MFPYNVSLGYKVTKKNKVDLIIHKYFPLSFFFTCFFKVTVLSFLLILSRPISVAQNVYVHYIFNEKDISQKQLKYFHQKHQLASKDLLIAEKENALILLAKEGFLTAYLLDSIIDDKNHVFKIFLGQKYSNIQVKLSDEIRFSVPKIGLRFSQKNEYQKMENIQEYKSMLDEIISFYQNNGYPFAKLIYPEFEFHENRINVSIHVEKGRKLVWNEVVVKGDSSFAKEALYQLIDIHPDEAFSLEKLQKVDSKLMQANYLELIKPSDLVFTDGGAFLYTYLKSRKTSSFNGAIGLQPDPLNQKLSFTGELQLKLSNTLKHAEYLEIHWRSIRPATQSLNANLMYPYFLRSPLGVEAKFNLYKRDSTFLELKSAIAFQYTVKSGMTFKALYQFTGNNRLNAASSSVLFPNTANTKSSMYGLGASYKKMDYLPNPTKGVLFQLEGLIGQRTVVKDSTFQSMVGRVSLHYETFIRLQKRWVFHYKLGLESYWAPQVYSNECFRFGGLQNLRGFNEENFIASTKNTHQIELRYLLDLNSSVFVFYDQGFYENTSNMTYQNDFPFGFGLGANLGSKVGIFSLAYALGIEKQNPLDLKSGKIHLGYIINF